MSALVADIYEATRKKNSKHGRREAGKREGRILYFISCIECSTRFSNNSYKMSLIENEYYYYTPQTSDCVTQSMMVFDGNFTFNPHINKKK